MAAIKIPREYKERLGACAQKHGFASAEVFGQHLLERGLKQYSSAPGAKLAQVVEDNGYSSEAELIEHLLERGLRAYEEPERDPAKLQARLRGLGYID